MTRPIPDPGPRPGTRLHREYPDLATPAEPTAAQQSTTWRLRRDDGTESMTEVDGSPLAVPSLRDVLHALFAEPEPHTATLPPDDGSLLSVTWLAGGTPVGSAELLADGRLLTDEGTGAQLNRRLNPRQLRAVKEAIAAAEVLRS